MPFWDKKKKPTATTTSAPLGKGGSPPSLASNLSESPRMIDDRRINSLPIGAEPDCRKNTNSSYYSFNGTPWDGNDPNSVTWMYARDARSQQQQVAPGRRRPYPSAFGNHPDAMALDTVGSPLKAGKPPRHLHHPLIPGQPNAWVRRGTNPPGAVRSFYTDPDPNTFNVGYHDPRRPSARGGHDLFSRANYHPPNFAQQSSAQPRYRTS